MPPVRGDAELRWEHLARRVTLSPWYFLVFGIAVLMAWLDNLAIAVGITLPIVIVVLVLLPRTRWGKARTGPVSPRDTAWADLGCLVAGVAYLVLSVVGHGPLWSTLLAGALALGYLSPRVLHRLDV